MSSSASIDLAPTVLALAGVEIPAHLQGRVLVGPRAGRAPEFVFAARDRMDIEYDMMRSARDARFLYIRNFVAGAALRGPHHLSQPERIMQEWLRLQAERTADRHRGAVDADAAGRPRSCTTRQADPHQIRNLADDPAHRATLERMRKAVTDWMARIGDQGLVNEPEMIQRMWPGGVQPETAQPYIVPRRTTGCSVAAAVDDDQRADRGRHLRADSGRVDRLHDRRGTDAEWRLYTGPILVDRPDDAARQGHPLRLQGKRGSARHVHEVAGRPARGYTRPLREVRSEFARA